MLCIFTSMQYHNVLMSSKAVFFSVVLSTGRIVMPRDRNINSNELCQELSLVLILLHLINGCLLSSGRLLYRYGLSQYCLSVHCLSSGMFSVLLNL